MHSTFLGAGSHSPFSIHVDVWGPLNISPGEQLKVTVVPSTAGSVYPITLTPELVVWSIGFPHWTEINVQLVIDNIAIVLGLYNLTVVQSIVVICNILSTRR